MRLLDLFCGAGGCAQGYANAGFEVVGVDINPQPNYPFTFYQADALDWLRDDACWVGFDAIHASPPCQHYANVTRWRGDQDNHPDLVGETRELLKATGLPYVIENVKGAKLDACFVLCGSMFGLPLRRHRYFETNWARFQLVPRCQHQATDYSFDHGAKQPESVYRDAMGCEWMTVKESREAVPPAYTEYIGQQLMAHLTAQEAA